MRRLKTGKKIYSLKEASARILDLVELCKKRNIIIQSERGSLVFMVNANGKH
jgi:hypothetical protein